MNIGFTGHRNKLCNEQSLLRIEERFPGATWVHGGAEGFDTQVHSVCGEEYNASRISHTCQLADLEKAFLQELDQPEACNLNGDALAGLRREIIANGSPTKLVRMWERSAGRKFNE